MNRSSRLRDLGGNTRLALATALTLGHEDPLLLLIQVSRRLPARLVAAPARWLVRPRRGRDATTRTVLGLWLAGQRGPAADALAPAAAAARTSRRLLAELATELGRPERGPVPTGPTAARAAWLRGDIDGAVDLAERAGRPRLAARYRAERSTLQPGHRPDVRPHARAPHHTEPAGHRSPAALHLLTNSLPHTGSGYALRSHAVLRAQQAAGIRVGAVTRPGYPVSVGRLTAAGWDDVDGVRYRRLLPARPARTATGRLEQHVEALLPVARAFRPGVVHTTTDYRNGLVAAAVAGVLGVPWVYEVRGLLEQTWLAGRPTQAAHDEAERSQRYTLLRAREAEVATSADHVVTLSRTMRADLVARGVPAGRISVVPNAVDARLLALGTTPRRARAVLGLPEAGFWVGTVSSLVDYEGLDTLVDAVAELRRRGTDVRLCIVGDGVARAGLEHRAAAAGLQRAALFPGRVTAAEAVRWHQALDVFAVTRRDVGVCRRVTPLKPMEAMALGRPVIASDLPALAEIVGEPRSGLLTGPGDPRSVAEAIAALADDPGLRSRLSEAGRDFAATRTWQRNGARYRAVYDALRQDAA